MTEEEVVDKELRELFDKKLDIKEFLDGLNLFFPWTFFLDEKHRGQIMAHWAREKVSRMPDFESFNEVTFWEELLWELRIVILGTLLVKMNKVSMKEEHKHLISQDIKKIEDVIDKAGYKVKRGGEARTDPPPVLINLNLILNPTDEE